MILNVSATIYGARFFPYQKLPHSSCDNTTRELLQDKLGAVGYLRYGTHTTPPT